MIDWFFHLKTMMDMIDAMFDENGNCHWLMSCQTVSYDKNESMIV